MARKTKAEKKADDKFLKDMRERMDRSVDNEHEERIQGNADIRFINGDDQWEDSVKRDRKDRLMLTINKMPTFLDQIDGDIRIVRKPRENIRSEAVLKVETLREKLVAMAELKGETVPESILEKADLLESAPADEIINAPVGGKVEVA